MLDVVYKRLRSAIQAGDLHAQAGKPLSLRQIASRLGTSTTPVREAVRKLEAEGLVTVARGSGILVHRLSTNEFSEITEMRVRLETLALERAFDHFTAAKVHRLDSMVAALDGFTDTAAWRDLNQEFHEATYEAGDYSRVLSTVKTLWVVVEPYLRLYSESAQNVSAAQAEHRQLVAAIREQDSKQPSRPLSNTFGVPLPRCLMRRSHR